MARRARVMHVRGTRTWAVTIFHSRQLYAAFFRNMAQNCWQWRASCDRGDEGDTTATTEPVPDPALQQQARSAHEPGLLLGPSR